MLNRPRGKYSHPCDACAVRKIRCDGKFPCQRCLDHNIDCTHNRPRKRSGPKTLRQNTLQQLQLVVVELSFQCKLTLQQVVPFLQFCQTFYYSIYPIVLIQELSARLVGGGDLEAYATGCAIAAGISNQLQFLSTHSIALPNAVPPKVFAEQARLAANYIDTKANPLFDSMVISFFLYVYHVNTNEGLSTAIGYLREAITTAQILRLHMPETYDSVPPKQAHWMRKVYYLLMVTERFVCLSSHVPIVLESSITVPLVIDDDYRLLFNGFDDLVKVFSIADKSFFEKLSHIELESPEATKRWVIDVQFQLQLIHTLDDLSDTQKLNVVLLKYWMQVLCWRICNQKKILLNIHGFDLLLILFPIHVARQLLEDTSTMSLFAFESNGPGVCVKLCQIGEGLCELVDTLGTEDAHTREIACTFLHRIYCLITELKNDLIFPRQLYQRIHDTAMLVPPSESVLIYNQPSINSGTKLRSRSS